MKTITVQELKALKDQHAEFQLIDVREVYEYEEVNIGGNLIPLGEIPTRYNEISKEKKVIMQCRSGVRSANAAMYLEQNYGYNNLYNLEGGILAWLNVFGE
ncbi:MAG: rhodanese-like domain-containing protein [Bacteroidetes bacterium]|nr:rhodanese-like domain-containing protein [Bacteroidota bacterium]